MENEILYFDGVGTMKVIAHTDVLRGGQQIHYVSVDVQEMGIGFDGDSEYLCVNFDTLAELDALIESLQEARDMLEEQPKTLEIL